MTLPLPLRKSTFSALSGGSVIETVPLLVSTLFFEPGTSEPTKVMRDIGAEQCGIVTFTVAGHDPSRLVDALLARGINVSFTTRAGTRLDMEARGLSAMLRASVHYYNSEDEIERFCTALATLL